MTSVTTPASTRARPHTWMLIRARVTHLARISTHIVRNAASNAFALAGLALITTAAWTTFGQGAGLLASGISLLLLDVARDR